MGGSKEGSNMIAVKLILLVISVVFLALLAYYNLERVSLNFLFFSLEAPLFSLVGGSFAVGFLGAYLLTAVSKGSLARKYKALERGLYNLWRGYPQKALSELEKVSKVEEFLPLYIKASKEANDFRPVYLEEFKKGIAETLLAQERLRVSLEDAVDLLEKGLGKDLKNLRAKRLLRDLYFIKGEHKKAFDLQRDIISESEKKLKDREKRVLTSLAFWAGLEAELSPKDIKPTAVYWAFKVPELKPKDLKKILEDEEAPQIVAISAERNKVSPALVEEIQKKEESMPSLALALVYLSIGRLPKVLEILSGELAPFISENLKTEDIKALIKLYKPWVCSNCGREYAEFSPVCKGCFEWNTFKVKGGSYHVN